MLDLMRKLSSLICLCCMLLFFAGCQDVVQVKLDQGSKLYVIDAFLGHSRINSYIRVTTSSPYFSDEQVPPVEDAKILLKDLTRGKSFTFYHLGYGMYVCDYFLQDTVCREGHQYELHVTIAGATYTALATQKRPAKIDSISSTYYKGTNPLDPDEKPYYLCTLWAKDKADNNPDYYWIKVHGKNIPAQLNVCVDGTNGIVRDAAADSIPFGPPATLMGLKRYIEGESGIVEIYSITRETYEFFIQAGAQLVNGGLFAKTPENLKTNIYTPPGAGMRAVGWFSMSSVSEKVFTVR